MFHGMLERPLPRKMAQFGLTCRQVGKQSPVTLSALDLFGLTGKISSEIWQLGTMPVLQPIVEGRWILPRVEIVNSGAEDLSYA